jgi:hypothetical protein
VTFAATGGYRLTISKTGTGTVMTSPAGISCGATCSALFEEGTSVTVQARTTNGSESFFSRYGFGADCRGPTRDCTVVITGPRTITATFSPMTNNLIFVTSGIFPTNLGSASAYDPECNRAATAAGINDGTGTAFVAFVSDAVSLAKDRLGSARGWVRMDGQPFADSLGSLFPGQQVFNAVLFDENGTPLRQDVETLSGADSTGAALSGYTCGNWTAVGGMGVSVGLSNRGPVLWGGGTFGTCVPHRLTCMGKTKVAAASPVASSGRKIWVTKTTLVMGSVTPDARCQAEMPAGVTGAAAFISLTSRAAAAVLIPDFYIRPDLTYVGHGTSMASTLPLASGIWQDADGVYLADGFPVWTGAKDVQAAGLATDTCGNWTDLAGAGGLGVVTSPELWWSSQSMPCVSNVYRHYCVQTSP